jgi:hypothetical protein
MTISAQAVCGDVAVKPRRRFAARAAVVRHDCPKQWQTAPLTMLKSSQSAHNDTKTDGLGVSNMAA